MRLVHIKLEFDVVIKADEGVGIEEALYDMTFDFIPTTDGIDVIDKTITNYEITDSR